MSRHIGKRLFGVNKPGDWVPEWVQSPTCHVLTLGTSLNVCELQLHPCWHQRSSPSCPHRAVVKFQLKQVKRAKPQNSRTKLPFSWVFKLPLVFKMSLNLGPQSCLLEDSLIQLTVGNLSHSMFSQAIWIVSAGLCRNALLSVSPKVCEAGFVEKSR